MTAWVSDCNGEKLSDFQAELAKEEPSKGSFAEDYAAFTAAHEIVPCPFINANNGVCRITNTIID